MVINTTLLLNGHWNFALDPQRKGKQEQWYLRKLEDTVCLPGTTDSNAKGSEYESPNYRNLNRRHSYMGWAWYQKEIIVPENFAKKTVTLYLERCLWESFLWVDGIYVGTEDSLAAPHQYDLSDILTPGRHTLTLLIDNSNLQDASIEDVDTTDRRDLTTGASQRWKHNCGGHHTTFLMPTNWNGILGQMELRAEDPVRLVQADIYPQKGLHQAKVTLQIENRPSYTGEALVRYQMGGEGDTVLLSGDETISLSGERYQSVTFCLSLPDGMTPWSEFTPVLYHFDVQLVTDQTASRKSVTFGLRNLEVQAGQILLNGHPVFLRGTVENCTFPLTFAPPTELAEWQRIFRIVREYGLNHMRFHSFCPPEAAFIAADQAGVLLQIELPGTSCPDYMEAPEDTQFLQRELERILHTYGGHPSFGMVSMGNEQLVATDKPEVLAKQQEILTQKVAYGQKIDPRHLYTCTSHPCTHGRIDDYFVSAWTMKGWDAMNTPGAKKGWDCFLTGIQWGGPDPLTTCFYCCQPPTLDHDYDAGLAEPEKPFISHEVGQWEVFPNVEEIPHYCGVLEPGNLQLIRDDLEQKGLLPLVPDFVRASGKLSLMLYRDEIETMLKSRKLSGFQLLDLMDYPGQGTSTVGILDSCWGSKGLITPEEYRQFCSSLVLLLRTEKRVYCTGETIFAAAEAANYQTDDRHTRWKWTISSNGETLASGGSDCTATAGTVSALGKFSYILPQWEDARQLTITLELEGTGARNSWDFWVYPTACTADRSAIITQWDSDAAQRLLAGERLLLLPESVPGALPGVFTTVFWNPQMKKQTGTFGILNDPHLPALSGFPNEGYTQWQWWDILQDTSVMDLSVLPVTPQIRVIDSFMTNRHLGILFEASVGAGKLLVCSAGLGKSLDNRPASRWMLECLLRYLYSNRFDPAESLSPEQLDRFFA